MEPWINSTYENWADKDKVDLELQPIVANDSDYATKIVVMDNLREIAEEVYKDQELAKEAGDLSKEIREAVEKYAIVAGEAKDFYAYEVDGFGQYNVM